MSQHAVALAVDALAYAHEAPVELEAALAHALDLTDDRALILGADRRLRFVSMSLARRLGVPREALVGVPISDLYTSPKVGGEVGEHVEALLRRGEAGASTFRTADGRFFRLSAVPLADGGWAIVSAHETGGFNAQAVRARLNERIEAASAAGEPLSLLYLDLDRFKAVNDTLGHAVGDGVLAKVVERMQAAIGPDDLLARLGGDEFAVAAGCGPRAASGLAEALIELVGRPCLVQGHVVQVGLSVGIAALPEDATDPERLLRSADLALYAAKSAGRGCWRRFEPVMDARMAERRALEFELRRAAKMGEFELHYQPQVDPRTGAVISCEALLRWRNPDRGMVPPGDFIGLAEEIGLMGSIGAWVIEAAARDALRWDERIGVAVNVSPVQFAGGTLVATVRDVLAATGLAPHRLEIEITESVLLRDTEANLRTLAALREVGVRIAMDDFGIGYSSLSYLSKFPFDKIKIDRSFVARMTEDAISAAIVRAVADLGAELGMSTIAEGIETDAQLAVARERGFSALQGFLFSRPLPPEELMPLLARAKPE